MADQMDTDDLLKRALQEAYPEIDPLLS
jgi:hypothetical protein